ncbi:hypothetical protein N826_22190 [Skermanella aerolata KACC 11604]|nr:hypothetical protein N826_22190 [Skermanella aerolata KACC 11604]
MEKAAPGNRGGLLLPFFSQYQLNAGHKGFGTDDYDFYPIVIYGSDIVIG